MDLGGAGSGVDEVEIERGRGDKNVNSLRKKWLGLPVLSRLWVRHMLDATLWMWYLFLCVKKPSKKFFATPVLSLLYNCQIHFFLKYIINTERTHFGVILFLGNWNSPSLPLEIEQNYFYTLKGPSQLWSGWLGVLNRRRVLANFEGGLGTDPSFHSVAKDYLR